MPFLPDETPIPDGSLSPFGQRGTPAGEGSDPVEAVPVSQEAMAESENRINSGATPYAIIDEDAYTEERQVTRAAQNAPFDHLTPTPQMVADEPLLPPLT